MLKKTVIGAASTAVLGSLIENSAFASAPEKPAEDNRPPAVRKIERYLTNFLKNDPRNKLVDFENATIWEAPLFAYASADDPLFEKLKTPGIVGPAHISPSEWLPGAKTVISYFFPFSEKVRSSNYADGMPSFGWVAARVKGEIYKNQAGTELLPLITSLGGKAIVPINDPRFTTDRGTPERKWTIPTWSERHVAYIAGLGTFGLNKSLITKRGAAGRFGSVVTTLELPVTQRPYSEPYSYCPHLVNGGCGACIPRCPVKAVFDKPKEEMINTKDDLICGQFYGNLLRTTPQTYHGYRAGCGKCVTAVPCEFGIPAPDTKRVAWVKDRVVQHFVG
jgi:epoxyqueuosine reductase QueG